MKQLKNSKLTLWLTFLSLSLVIIVLIDSCRKDATKTTSSPNTMAQINIATIKELYNNAMASNNSAGLVNKSPLNLIKTIDVNWNSYNVQNRKDGSAVAEFNMNNDTTLITLKSYNLGDTIKYRNKTTVNFIKYNNGKQLNFYSKIIEDLNERGKKSVINNVHYMQIPKSFTGLILYYTLSFKFMNGYHYTNGLLDRTVSMVTADNIQKSQIIVDDDSSCTTLYFYAEECMSATITGDDGNLINIDNGCTETYLGSSTLCATGVGDGIASGDGNGGGSVGSLPLSALNDITNNTTSPCLNQIINTLGNGHISTDLTNMFWNNFQTSDVANLTFSQADLTTQIGTDAAQTSDTQVTTNGITYNNIDVIFNNSAIQNASNEYLAETVMHEIYHAYLDANTNIKTMLAQHLTMAQNYVNSEVQTLQALFPTLSTHDADCLVIGGYGDIQNNDQTAMSAILAAYNLTANDVANTNNNYKNGTAGTRCPY
jgi:hypothetical protein